MILTKKKSSLIELTVVMAVMVGIYSAGIILKTLSIGLVSVVTGWLLCHLILKLRKERWRCFGLKKPKSWPKVILVSFSGVLVLHVLISQVLKPLMQRLSLLPPNLNDFEILRGNVPVLLSGLAIVWTVAAFGEELIFRGFLLNRLAGVFKFSRAAWGLAMILSSLLFGLGHVYQGLSGMIISTIVGLFYVLAYFLTGKNLWAPILIHGIYDTKAFLAIFFSLDKKTASIAECNFFIPIGRNEYESL